jgi:hypothetical protein
MADYDDLNDARARIITLEREKLELLKHIEKLVLAGNRLAEAASIR